MKANHLFYLFFFYFIYSTSVSSQGFINMPTDESFTTEYQDGRYWGYLIRDNIVVAACLSELEENDDYYQLSLVVDNQSGFNRNFLPDSIQGYAYTHDGKKVKTVDIYSFEEMQKKIRSKKRIRTALSWLSVGLSVGPITYYGGTWGSSISTSYHLGPMTSLFTSIALPSVINSAAQGKTLNIQDKGYLKSNTIRNGEGISGYMMMERRKARQTMVRIKIDQTEFLFQWDTAKK